MKITKSKLKQIIREELTNEIRERDPRTDQEIHTELSEMLFDLDMTPTQALIALIQLGVVDITLDLGRFLKE